jgi:hypothetical protein
MEQGATLHVTHTKSGSYWTLSDGTCVASHIALMVVNDLRIVGVGDSLFDDVPCQTWHYVDPPT